MIRNSYLIIFFFLLSCISCVQKKSKTEEDYIRNLEEKNRALENELKEEKDKPPVIIEKPVERVYVQPQNSPEINTSKDFFTIGSTEDEVIEVMGDPTNVMDFGSIGMKRFSYGLSTISFKNGRVDGYNNYERNLKVKMKK